MKVLFRSLWLASFVLAGLLAATGQTPTAPSNALNIKGIKIIGNSTYDPATSTVNLTFLNDRAADLTAYHYCIDVLASDPKVSHRECFLIDALHYVLDEKAELKERPWLNANLCSMPICNVVHPGQMRLINKFLGYPSILNATASVDLVVWSDNQYDGNQVQEQAVLTERSAQIEQHRFISKTIKDVLANGQEKELVATTLATLQQEHERLRKDVSRARDSSGAEIRDGSDAKTINTFDMAAEIEHMQKPNNRKADDTAFVPDNQRAFLQQLADRHDFLAAEFTKQVALRKVGDQ